LPIVDLASLGRRFLDLYTQRRVSIEINVEGKDIETNIFVPLCNINYNDAELNITTDQSPTVVLTDLLKVQDPELDSYPDQTKEAARFVEKVADEREKWVRDCVFASGLIEPTYSLLGFKGMSANPRKPLASFLTPESYLHFFDTNVFMKHLLSNYFTLRRTELDKIVAATVPAVIWELEALSSRDSKDPRESRIAKSAFRDISIIQGSTGYFDLLPETEDDAAEPSDRLIRRQIRRLNWTGIHDTDLPRAHEKLFVTFDRISSLAAHAESLLCIALDLPIEKESWDVVALDSQRDENMLGSVLREFSIMFGMMRLRCEGLTDLYISGDWAGKTSHEWIEGLTRLENSPI
jgi:hypothetical protein